MEQITSSGSATPPEPSQPWTWRSIALFLVTLLAVVLALTIAAPFVPALTWSVALAVSTQRPHAWVLRKVKKPGFASILLTLGIMVLIVAPVLLLLERLASQLFSLIPLVTSGAAQAWLQSTMTEHPRLNGMFQKATAGVDLQDTARSAAAFAAGKLQGVLAGSVSTLTQMAIMLYTLFFLFRDGKQAKEALASVLPMTQAEGNNLLGRMQDAVQASVLGSLTIAAVQGALGGIIFGLLQVPNAVLWAFVMGTLATVPSLGTFLVWAPVAIFLALSGHLVKAGILFAFGAIVIGSADNLLYPTLVSKKLQMHTLAAFFGVLGGVAVFGVSGIVLGPLVLVTATELIRLWQPAALRATTSD
ncbi:MAG: AI-2E family transporter [Janthinobacterium lividum]